MSIEKVLVENWIVISERFSEARQPSGGNLLQRRLVRFMPNAADVEHHSILRVHIRVHDCGLFNGVDANGGKWIVNFNGAKDVVNLIRRSLAHRLIHLPTRPPELDR